MKKLSAFIYILFLLSSWITVDVNSATSHSPISISSDSDFATLASQEGWPGDGSINNPYIIADIAITGSGYAGISISSTTAYFVIQNVSITGFIFGIALNGVANGVINGTTIDSTEFAGVDIMTSSNILLQDLSLWNNSLAVSIMDSSNINITRNSFYNNSQSVLIRSSSAMVIGENTFYNYSVGLEILSSNGFEILGNEFINGSGGAWLEDSFNLTLTNNSYHSIASPINLYNSTNAVVENSFMENAQHGILVTYGENINVLSNEIINSVTSLSMTNISHSQIMGNKIYENDNGIYLNNANNTIISNNFLSNITSSGIYGMKGFQNTFADNSIENSDFAGINLFDGMDISVMNNTAFGNKIGLSFSGMTNTTIQGNFAYNNVNDGIYAMGSNYSIVNNEAAFNDIKGFNLFINDSIVMDNFATFNGYGFFLQNPFNVEMINNTALNNTFDFHETHPYTPPTISAANNITVAEFSPAVIEWVATDEDPSMYYVFLNGEQIDYGTWVSGLSNTITLTGLEPGIYNVTLLVKDMGHNAATHTVWLTVTNQPPQIISEPDDLQIEESQLDQSSIEWIAMDTSPNQYQLFMNGIVVDSGNWISNASISFSLDNLNIGMNNITIVLSDSLGLFTVSTHYIKSSQIDQLSVRTFSR